MFTSLLLATVLAAPALAQGPAEPLTLNIAVGLAGADQRAFTQEELEDALIVIAAAKFRDAVIVTDNSDALNLSLSVSCVAGACSWRARLTTKLIGGPFGDAGFADWWSAGGIMRDRGGLERLRQELNASLDRPAASWLRLGPAQRSCWTRYFAEPIAMLPQPANPEDALLRPACAVPANEPAGAFQR